MCAETRPNTGAEGEVCEPRTLFFCSSDKPFRTEAKRLLVEARVPMDDPRAKVKFGPGGNRGAAGQCDWYGRVAEKQPGRRVESHAFLQNGPGVGQLGEIWKPVSRILNCLCMK